MGLLPNKELTLKPGTKRAAFLKIQCNQATTKVKFTVNFQKEQINQLIQSEVEPNQEC